MIVSDITNKINTDVTTYVDIYSFYTKENIGSIGADYVLGNKHTLEQLENMVVVMIEGDEDCNINLYVDVK